LEVWGSIDLLGGKVVRLVKGDPTSTIVYSNNPLHVARKLSSLGLDGLHIVDIDAALGRGRNTEIIKSIIENTNMKTQVGGGIRTFETAASLLDMGVSRVVIGTALFTNHKPSGWGDQNFRDGRLTARHGCEQGSDWNRPLHKS